jgi:hypothetical protein
MAGKPPGMVWTGRPRSEIFVGYAKRQSSTRRAQARYSLLVLALGGVCWLLTAVLLHELTEKMDHEASLTSPANLVPRQGKGSG